MWYKSLPGVPTTMWGLLFSSFTWLFRSMLPIMTATLRPILAPKALKWSAIWTTSSLAGAITKAKKGQGLTLYESILIEKTFQDGQSKGQCFSATSFGKCNYVPSFESVRQGFCLDFCGFLVAKALASQEHFLTDV